MQKASFEILGNSSEIGKSEFGHNILSTIKVLKISIAYMFSRLNCCWSWVASPSRLEII
jgi:hypothetical protein